MDTEYVDILPDTSLMEKISKTGYSFTEIIAEFIDNSIDAFSTKILVDIYQDLVKVVDNGIGMSRDELINAFKLGKCNKQNTKLGMYGLGLKAAAISLGNYFEVITVERGKNKAWRICWDQKSWQHTNGWKIPINECDVPKEIRNGGTIIRVKELKVKTGNKIAPLKTEIGQRFAHYLKRDVTVLVNNNKCKAKEPQLIKGSVKQIKIVTIHGIINGWVGLMTSSSQKNQYGFSTFRYNRMITYFDKFGFKPHSSKARVYGELHMDYIPVTVNKRGWEQSSPLYEEAWNLVYAEIKDTVNESIKMATRVHIKKADKIKMEKFKEGLIHALGCERIQQFTRPERAGRTSGGSGGSGGIGVITTEVEKRNREQPPVNPGTAIPADTGRKRIPKVTHPVKRNVLIINGKEIDYAHDWGTLGKDGPIYDSNYNDSKKKFEVITNVDFPALKIATDTTYYSYLHLVDAVSKLVVELSNLGLDKKDTIFETILRESSIYLINN